jgi:hypothetical protein
LRLSSPNRLKTVLKSGFSASYPNSSNPRVTWLLIARNLKVEMQAKFSQQTTSFKIIQNTLI